MKTNRIEISVIYEGIEYALGTEDFNNVEALIKALRNTLKDLQHESTS